MGLLGLSAPGLYMKIGPKSTPVLCKDSEMDCIFTPGKNLAARLKGWGKNGLHNIEARREVQPDLFSCVLVL